MDIIKKIADEMRKAGVINEDGYKIYQYGLELVVLKVAAAVMAIIVSLMLKTTLFLLLLLIFLVPIRKYAGGVHASSRKACLCLTEIILLGAQLAWKYGIWVEQLQPMAIILGLMAIVMLSPAESEKRKLKNQKRKKFRYISLTYGSINGVCFIMSYLRNWNILKSAISLAMFIEAALLFSSLPGREKKRNS